VGSKLTRMTIKYSADYLHNNLVPLVNESN
jgi:hypothetical protein